MAAFKRLVPLLDRVLVEKVAPMTKTVGGILLPETASSKARRPRIKMLPGLAEGGGRRRAARACGSLRGDARLRPWAGE